MRRFTILAVAAFVAVTTAFAQPAPARQEVKKVTAVKTPETRLQKVKLSEVSLKEAIKTTGQKKQQVLRAKTNKSREASLAQRDANRKVAKIRKAGSGVIIDQPEGKLYDEVFSHSFIASSLFGTFMGQNPGAIGEVVEGTDGCLYIHNLLSQLQTTEGYWVKAEKVEGDRYVIHEQPIWEEDYYGDIYVHSIMKLNMDAEGNLSLPDNTDIYITWKDGKLETADEFNGDNFTSVISGIDDGGYWSGSAVWDVHMTPLTDTAITQLPEGAQVIQMVMKYTNDEGELFATKVSTAFAGSDVFVQLNSNLGWVKGSLQDGKAVFYSGQYLGKDYGNNIQSYFLAADSELNILEKAEFDFDQASNTLTAGDMVALINAGKETVYYSEAFESPVIFLYVDNPGTPQKPEVTEVYDYTPYPSYGQGYGYFIFDGSYFDANGNFLDYDQLYYKVYIDDKVYTFQPNNYSADLEEPTQLIPFMFDGYDFSTDGITHYVYTYLQPAKNVGVQLVFTGGGETHESEIAWYEMNNNLATGEEGVIAHVEDGAPNKKVFDGEIALNLGYAMGKESCFGTVGVADETYDVAFHLTDPSLVGAQITAINVPFLTTAGISNTKVWLSKTLSVNEGQFTADVVTQEFSPVRGFTQVALDQPYTITEEGIYIGYSFTQEDNSTAVPVVLTGYTSDGGFLVHTSEVYANGWFNMYQQWGDLALEAVLKGGNIKANSLTPENASQVFAQIGQESTVMMDLTNYGYKGAKNIDYTYEVAGLSGTGHIDLDPTLAAVYGAYHTFKLPLPAIAQKGEYPLNIKVTMVNGKANEAINDQANTTVTILTVMPKKRPVLEEYTGTWCGYCPRGYVALQKMSKLYPEDFIALSYHNDDPMEFTYDFPSDVKGFPDAWLDRVHQTDAYCGDGEYGEWGIEKVWLDRCNEFGTADISVTADWADDSQNLINVTSTIIFPFEVKDNPYQIEYALVADGLKGTTDDWAQSNYYGGVEGWSADMSKFVTGDKYVTGLTFDDVIVDRKIVMDALPASIAGDATIGNAFQLSADNALNTSGEPIIQSKDKVRVVVMLVNTKTGEIINAAKCKVMPAGTGINAAAASRIVDTVNYYDLSGRKVLIPNGGVYIKSIRYKDGTTLNQKVLVK